MFESIYDQREQEHVAVSVLLILQKLCVILRIRGERGEWNLLDSWRQNQHLSKVSPQK